MADKKFTQLTAAGALVAADLLAIAQSPFGAGSSKSITGTVLAAFINSTVAASGAYLPLSGGTITGDLATVGLAAFGTAVVAGVQLTVQDAAASTFLFINNNKTPGGAAGSGGNAVLILRSTTLASYGWRLTADGAVDRLLFQDEGAMARAWMPAQANSAFGIGDPTGTGVLMHTTADGRLLLTNVAATDFSRLQFGGTTAAFPAIARSSTNLILQLADGTGNAGLTTGSLNVIGSLALPYVAKTGTYTVTSADFLIDATANVFTVTLPTAVGVPGRMYVFKNSGTGVLTVCGNGAETIDGETEQILLAQWTSMTVVSNGANWIII